jgi:hypothetical protein
MYEASVPVFSQLLGGTSGIIDKMGVHCTEKKIDPSILLSARLFPNMYTFSRQVQVASDWANRACAWLGDVAPLSFANDEASADELKARIAKVIAFINGIDKAAIEAGATREISWPAGPNTRRMIGQDFLLHQALPQFYFHQTAAYSILRHNGVELAKRDFMGAVPRMTQS